MRKRTAVTGILFATTPAVGAALAVAVTILLGGCTSSGTPSPQGSTSTPTASTATTATATAMASPTAAAGTATGGSSGSTGTATASTGSGAGGGSTSTAAPAGASTCTGAQLSLSTSQDSAAGLFDYIVIEFVNHSSTPCTVDGYPGAAGYGVTSSNYAINSTRQLTGKVGDRYTAPAPITLTPGSTASTILEWIDKPTPGHPYAYCLRRGAGSFGITAPNTTQTTHTPLPSDVCSGLLVHPLIPGSTGRQR